MSLTIRTMSAIAGLGLSLCLLSGCGLSPQPPAPYGSGGQGALPDASSALTGITMSHSLGGSSEGANDRTGGGVP